MFRAILLGVLFTFATAALAQETKKTPIPSKDAQAEIEKLLQEIYGPRFKKAETDVGERTLLAQELLREGRDTKDNATGRYVMYLRAHQLAAQAGDVATALSAADALANDFVLPTGEAFQMKIKLLQQASKVAGAPDEAYRAVVERAILILEDTLDADDYASSADLITAAELAARKLRSLNLVVTMRKKQDEIARAQKEFARWQPFADTLAKDPTDADANLEMGKYYALIMGNWERGLPLIAQGKKSVLQSLAKSDLAMPDTDKGRRVVALGWFLFAQTRTTEPALRVQAYLRAYYWYQENLAGADDKDRALIQAKLREINEMLPAESRIGEIAVELKKIDLSSGPVYASAFAPDGKRFITTGYDGNLHLFNARTFKELRQFDGHSGKVWCVAFAADGKHFVSGGFDNSVRLWNVNTGLIKTFDGHKDYVRSVAISADGKWILSGGDDRTVRLWNVDAGKEERVMKGHDHTVWGVALSRDGKRALSASLDKTARLWNLDTGDTIKKLEGHKDTVLCVAFTPDHRHAVTGSTDHTIRLWDLDAGKVQRTFDKTAGYVHSIAVSPDGQRILSAESTHGVHLWDTNTGKAIRTLEGHRDQVWHVHFSRDGRHAITSGQDNTVRIWTGAK